MIQIPCMVFKIFRSNLFIVSRQKFITISGTKAYAAGNLNKMEEVINQDCSQTEVKSKKRSFELSNEAVHIQLEEAKRPCSKKKKKFAILLSYAGQGYLGMQFNRGFKTIEGELFQAFLKLGIMDNDSFNTPQSIHFQRAARTDKGV